jgi:DNA-binding MarR family transcriptional regulator
VDAAERLRAVVGRLGRSLRLTHVDGNLSPSQREVLSTIVRSGPIRLSDVASDEGLNPTMVSRIVAHLEAAKLVTRLLDGVDARVVHLEPTDAGRALSQEIRNERTDALLYAIGQLSKEQQVELIRVLPLLESLVGIVKGRDR